MAKLLTKEEIQFVCDYLATRCTMPNNIAAICLSKLGIEMSQNYVRSIRQRFKIPYKKDAKIHNAIQFAKSHDLEVTHEYLQKKCPDICTEHRQYLIDAYAKKERKEIAPVKMGGIYSMVHQILMAP